MIEKNKISIDALAKLFSYKKLLDLSIKQFKEIKQLKKALAVIKSHVDKQAEDEGLWFIAKTMSEEYLQYELRELHRTIEQVLVAKQIQKESEMDKKKIKEMVSQIISDVDYDIWKEAFNVDTAEEPDEVEDNYVPFIETVQKYLSEEKDTEIDRLKKEKQDLVKLFCKQGVQYCHVCEDKSCGDNINKHL